MKIKPDDVEVKEIKETASALQLLSYGDRPIVYIIDFYWFLSKERDDLEESLLSNEGDFLNILKEYKK